MENTADQLKQAFQLRKQKKYHDAVQTYAGLWAGQEMAFTEWDGWSYAFCLKENRLFQQSLDICRQLYKRFPDFEMLRQLYAWNIYYTQLAVENIPEDQMLQKAIEGIARLCPVQNNYSPLARSIFKAVKFTSSRPQPNWQLMQQWLQMLDVHQLSQQTYQVRLPGKGKKVELASDVEEWYSWQSKCLLQMQQWQACIDICDQATRQIEQWHYSNNIWFARRKAACLAQLGERRQAFEIMEALVARKRDWFMLADLAHLTDNSATALALMAEAALAWGEPSKKLKLYEAIARHILEVDNKPEDAYQHFLLVYTLRKEQNWPIPASLIERMGEAPASLTSISSLLQALKKQWQQWAPPQTQYQGTIQSVLAGGRSGFIGYGDGKTSVYFTATEFKANPALLQKGAKVRFDIRQGFDKKKNKPSSEAFNIHVLAGK